MLEKMDTRLLFYNVFGVAIVFPGKIVVSLNIHKDGKIQGRMLEKELETNLINVSKTILIPFGAWVDQADIQFTPGRLEGYDAESYETNKEVIDSTITAALGLIRGAVAN